MLDEKQENTNNINKARPSADCLDSTVAIVIVAIVTADSSPLPRNEVSPTWLTNHCALENIVLVGMTFHLQQRYQHHPTGYGHVGLIPSSALGSLEPMMLLEMSLRCLQGCQLGVLTNKVRRVISWQQN